MLAASLKNAEGGFSKTPILTPCFLGVFEAFCTFSDADRVIPLGALVKIDFVVKPLDFQCGIFGSEIAKKLFREPLAANRIPDPAKSALDRS